MLKTATRMRLLLFLFILTSTAVSRNPTILNTDARVQNDANLSSLSIEGTNPERNAYQLNVGAHRASLRIREGDFQMLNDQHVYLAINQGEITTSKGTLFAKGLNLQKDAVINGKRQWSLVARMDYRDFDPKIVSKCGAYHLIGGYLLTSNTEMTKSFPLPRHSMIRIEGHFHFLDNWKGETGFIKVRVNKKDEQVVWTEGADIRGIANGIDVCGGATIDPIVGRKFEVVMNHDEDTLDLLFGSTLTCDPSYASYGVSDVEIYIL